MVVDFEKEISSESFKYFFFGHIKLFGLCASGKLDLVVQRMLNLIPKIDSVCFNKKSVELFMPDLMAFNNLFIDLIDRVICFPKNLDEFKTKPSHIILSTGTTNSFKLQVIILESIIKDYTTKISIDAVLFDLKKILEKNRARIKLLCLFNDFDQYLEKHDFSKFSEYDLLEHGILIHYLLKNDYVFKENSDLQKNYEKIVNLMRNITYTKEELYQLLCGFNPFPAIRKMRFKMKKQTEK